MQCRQLFEKESSTYTYLIFDEVDLSTIVIDPVIETWERDKSLITEMGL